MCNFAYDFKALRLPGASGFYDTLSQSKERGAVWRVIGYALFFRLLLASLIHSHALPDSRLFSHSLMNRAYVSLALSVI